MGHVIEETLIDIPIDCVRKLYEEMPNKVEFTKILRAENDDVAKYKVKVSRPCSLNYTIRVNEVQKGTHKNILIKLEDSDCKDKYIRSICQAGGTIQYNTSPNE